MVAREIRVKHQAVQHVVALGRGFPNRLGVELPLLDDSQRAVALGDEQVAVGQEHEVPRSDEAVRDEHDSDLLRARVQHERCVASRQQRRRARGRLRLAPVANAETTRKSATADEER